VAALKAHQTLLPQKPDTALQHPGSRAKKRARTNELQKLDGRDYLHFMLGYQCL